MKAVIMAGGEGTRLRPLTCNRPKPMVMVANKPVMEHIIELLVKHDARDIAVTLQYMPEQIKDYFNEGTKKGAKLKYYTEVSPLGTAGSVKNAEDFLDDTFVVISGDALTDIDLSKAIDFHKSKGSMATLVLKRVEVPLEYGIVVTNSSGRIIRFLEKPGWGEVFSDTVNTGIYILSPKVLDYFNKNEFFDFSKDLFPLLLKDKVPMYGYVTEDYWCDIGDINAYIKANMDAMDGKVHLNIPGNQIMERVWVDEDARIDEGVLIKGPCIIGKNCRIRKNAELGEYSVIGESSIISARAGIKRSILWKNCLLEDNVQLRGSVICDKVYMKRDVSSFENSIIGDDSVIKENVIIKPDIKIWPNKIIEPYSEVNTNLVWGSKFTRNIFGNRGVTGEINVDITPEYASKLGAAYGSTLKTNSRVAISCDDSSAAQMMKMSICSGIISSGAEIFDFGQMLIPVARSAIRFFNIDGGIHISACCNKNGRLCIDFLDSSGSSIDREAERKIETAFIREDFTRCECENLKPVRVISEYNNFYLRNITNNIKSPHFTSRLLINAPDGMAFNIMKRLMTELGCNADFIQKNQPDGSCTEEGIEEIGLKSLSDKVKRGKYDLGVFVEDGCEKMVLFDDKGRIITEDSFVALVSMILFKSIQGGTVYVPISVSSVIEKIADENNGRVIRTKTSHRDIMKSIFANEVKEEMLEQFTMHYDAMAGIVKILDFIELNGYKLSDLVNLIPDYHVNRQEVACPWNSKGRVIRQLMEENEDNEIETLEGIKIMKEKGWVLVLPDGERPLCKVVSEGYSAEFAEELSSIYINKIKEIGRN